MKRRIELQTQSVSDDWQDWLDEHQPQITQQQVAEGAHVFLFSHYVKQTSQRQPELLKHLIDHDCVATEFVPDVAEIYWQQPALSLSEREFMAQIRRFRTYHMLWIYWRDLSGLA